MVELFGGVPRPVIGAANGAHILRAGSLGQTDALGSEGYVGPVSGDPGQFCGRGAVRSVVERSKGVGHGREARASEQRVRVTANKMVTQRSSIL